MWLIILGLISGVEATTLDDSAAMADTLLSNTELLNPVANIQQCSAVTSGDDTNKQILKKSLAKTAEFSTSTSIDKCQGLTIYLDDKAERRAIGYYSANGSVRTFDRACAAGSSDADCRTALLKNFNALKTTGTTTPTTETKKSPTGFQPIAIDNTYVATQPAWKLESIPAKAQLQGYSCKDGSLSAEQGDSWGVGGWEGRCGQTAATNVLYSICQSLSPSLRKTGECSREDGVFNDATPGVHPATMASDYNDFLVINKCKEKTITHGQKTNTLIDKYLDGEVTLEAVYQQQEALVSQVIKGSPKHPTMFMIEVPGGSELHWVTATEVVKVNNVSYVKLNHWGKQYQYPLRDFAKLTMKTGWGESGVGFAFSDINYVQAN